MDYLEGEWTHKKILMLVCTVLGALLMLKVIMHLLPLAILLFLLLAPPIYVLADGQERKVRRPILWAVFTLFTSIFGLLVYLLARPEAKSRIECPHCHGEVDPAFKNCPWCGNAVAKTLKCAGCATELRPGWKFCPNCRVAVASPASETVSGNGAATA